MKVLPPILFGLCYVLSAHFAYGFTCIGTVNSWMMSGNQSPCDTYQDLIRLCIPGFAVGNLAYGQHYATGPEACGCNTVAASLIAACSDCQNSANYDGPSYQWYLTANTGGTNVCTSITNGSVSTTVSIPESIRRSIPSWAFIDINIYGGYWSYTNAYTVAFGGQLTSSQLPTRPESTASSQTTESAIPGPTSAPKGIPLPTVVGAVVGGFVGIIAIALVVLFCARSRRKKAANNRSPMAASETPALSYYSQPQSPTTPNYGKVHSKVERSNRPGMAEPGPMSFNAPTPDTAADNSTMVSNQGPGYWSGYYAPASLTPTFAGPDQAQSSSTGVNSYNVPYHAYEPPPMSPAPPPTHGEPVTSMPGSPSQAKAPPDYMHTAYNH